MVYVGGCDTEGHCFPRCEGFCGEIAGGEIGRLKSDDRTERTVDLKDAKLPLTPVQAIPSSTAAKGLPTLSSQLQTGSVELIVSTTGSFKESGFLLETVIKISSKDQSDIKLFAPALIEKQALGQPVDAAAIRDFASRIGKVRGQPSRLANGVFTSFVYLTLPKDPDAPALFVVDYPVTVWVKDRSFCLSVSVYGAFPVNVDEGYCQKR